MIKPRRDVFRYWSRVAVAMWLSACPWAVDSAESRGATADDWNAPQTIENPFFTKPAPAPTQATALAEPVSPTIAGDEVDTEAPPIYRLPPVEDETSTALSISGNDNEDAEIGPLPDAEEPSREMLDDLDAIWSGEFESGPDPSAGAAGAVPYTPTVAELSAQLLPSVRNAYGLARHGAIYAAQKEFIQVLRRIAQAKDAAEGVDEHSRALAAGLRALNEADDFVPQGVQLEGEMNVAGIVSSHRTPVVRRDNRSAHPHEAIALYHQYGRRQLALAVAGEQAGSMALHGLGKAQNRLALAAEGDLRHERKAMTMFQAALDAGPGNHLAANEIGVLLSRGGQPAEASAMFRRAIDIAPSSTTYHNLAVVERKLGNYEQAAANDRYAQQLAARDRAAGAVSRANGVQWVTPGELARVSSQQPMSPTFGPMAGRAQEARTGTIASWPQKLIPSVFRR